MGLWPKRGLLGRHRCEDRDAVPKALSSVGLEGFKNRPIDTLSGGQLQRALFARVLVQDADLILFDEPFNAIDTRTVTDLIGLIKRWHGEERTIMVVVHDLELVRQDFPDASGAACYRLGRCTQHALAGESSAGASIPRSMGRRCALVRAGRACPQPRARQ